MSALGQDPAAEWQEFANELNGAIAVCARCGAEGPAGSAEFTCSRQYEEFTCTDMTECEERLFEQAQAGDHPDGF